MTAWRDRGADASVAGYAKWGGALLLSLAAGLAGVGAAVPAAAAGRPAAVLAFAGLPRLAADGAGQAEALAARVAASLRAEGLAPTSGRHRFPPRLRGVPRVVPAGATTLQVDTSADTAATSEAAAAAACASGNAGTCSLRDAIEVADSLSAPAVVEVPAGEYVLTRGTLVLDNPQGLSVVGAGASSTVVGALEDFKAPWDSVLPGPSGQATGVSVVLSPSTAGATASYDVHFTTSVTGALASGDAITLSAPAGTIFPRNSANYTVLDDFFSGSSLAASPVSVGSSGNSVTIGLAGPVPAGDPVEVRVSGVKNPGTAGPEQLSVTTTSDPRTATSLPYSVTAASGQTTDVSVANTSKGSSFPASASATYVVSFVTSSTGGFAASTAASITVRAPAGTIFPRSNVDYFVGGQSANRVTVSSAGNVVVVTFVPSASIPGGSTVTLTVEGVRSPSAAASPESLVLATSADPAPTVSSPYAVVGTSSVPVFEIATAPGAAPAAVAGVAVEHGGGTAAEGGGVQDSSGGPAILEGDIVGQSNDFAGGGFGTTGSAYLVDDTFNTDRAYEGGAIAVGPAGSALLEDVRVEAGAAVGGGAVFNEGSLVATGLTVADSGALRWGGAILNMGALSLSGGSLSGEGTFAAGLIPSLGGGLANFGEATLTGVAVDGDLASGEGGGVFTAGSLSMSGGSLSGDGEAMVGGSTVVVSLGGGLVVGGGSASLSGVRVDGDSAGFGGGIGEVGMFGPPSLSMSGGSLSDDAAALGGGFVAVSPQNGGVAAALTVSSDAIVPTLSRMVFSGVAATGDVAAEGGGGVVEGAELSVSGGEISSDAATASFGGGLFAEDALVSLSGVVLGSDTAAEGGGGVAVRRGVVDIAGSTFSGDRASGGAHSVGFGGGLLLEFSTAEVSGVTVEDSVAGTSSGVGGGILSEAYLTLSASTLVRNEASEGAGLANVGQAELVNDTISANVSPEGSGAGIANGMGGVLVGTNLTISSNVVEKLGSSTPATAVAAGMANAGSATLLGTILSGDTVAGSDQECAPGSRTAISGVDDLESDASCHLSSADNLVDTNPELLPLADNGGPTETEALAPTSPAIGADAACPPPTTDQRGVPRPPGHCDIGAFQTPGAGYDLVEANGGVVPFGAAGFFGSGTSTSLASPVVGIARTPDARGYWLAEADGAVLAFGDARALGSLAGRHLNAPIVGIASAPTGEGYWLVGADGGVFAFGSASFEGSVPGALAAECVAHGYMPGCTQYMLAKPIVGIASAPTGEGYWLVGADGGVFAFGSASFEGSLGAMMLSTTVTGIASQ
jgi:hypothetical protein